MLRIYKSISVAYIHSDTVGFYDNLNVGMIGFKKYSVKMQWVSTTISNVGMIVPKGPATKISNVEMIAAQGASNKGEKQ